MKLSSGLLLVFALSAIGLAAAAPSEVLLHARMEVYDGDDGNDRSGRHGGRGGNDDDGSHSGRGSDGNHRHHHHGNSDGRGKCVISPPAVPRPTFDLATAVGIWSNDYLPANGGYEAPVGARVFRKKFVTPMKRGFCATRARFVVFADESFKLYVNGRFIGAGNYWQKAAMVFEADLSPHENVIVFEANNGPYNGPNGAALISKIRIDYTNGEYEFVGTGEDWRYSLTAVATPQMSEAKFDDSAWPLAKAAPAQAQQFLSTRPVQA